MYNVFGEYVDLLFENHGCFLLLSDSPGKKTIPQPISEMLSVCGWDGGDNRRQVPKGRDSWNRGARRACAVRYSDFQTVIMSDLRGDLNFDRFHE